jgi:hypothetical protein
VSSHLSFLTDDAVDWLTDAELGLILRDESLVAPSEDWLYGCVSRRFEVDPESASLLEWVRFEFLSVSSIEHFIEWTGHHSIDVSGWLWRGLCPRLLIDVRESVRPRFSRLPRRVVCDFDSGRPLEGIIAYLTRQCGGNVADRGVVAVTASSEISIGYTAKKAVDLTADSIYASEPEPNQWLCLDFKDRQVAVTHYAIRSHYTYGQNASHPKSWILEGSVDGSAWMELDIQQDNGQLNGQNLTAAWRTMASEKVRYMRLRHTGPNHAGKHTFWLSSFELFGMLYEPESD